jgi:S-DNA-T family DNA segregation ATPase FtsK/SpoIIIE
MLKQWLQKLKGLFDEKDTDESPGSHSQEQQKVKAKVAYQYPKQKAFRFPVIPDEPVKRQQADDTPAYLRRNREKYEDANHDPLRFRNQEVTSRKIHKDENAPPFKVTEVPSPIYGFQKRQNEIEQVPAFIRKEEHKKTENKEEKGIANPPDYSFNNQTNPGISEGETPEAINQTAAATMDQSETVSTRKEEQKPEQRNMDKRETRNIHKNRVKKKHRRRNNEKTGSNPIPFNVIMTPSDKKQLKPKPMKENNVTQEQNTKQENQHTIITDNRLQEGMHAPIHLLNDPEQKDYRLDGWIKEQQSLLEQTLKHFHVKAKVVHATQGPSVTRFEVQPDLGVKVSKIRNLSDDLKLNMSAKDIRIEAPIPGKNTVGIEVPNPKSQMVGLQEIIETDYFKKDSSNLSIALGVTIEGEPKVTNIQKMPHGLIAGATGSGKSVCINSILLSLIYKASHEDVKFLLIDPKMVELAPYNGIPHLVAPVITDVKAATQSLKWAVNEMEDRYERFMEEGVRDIERYNQKVMDDGRIEDKMPYIIIVIDELADLMMMSPQDVESSISRIAQKARACGMHLLLATQRPSVDVITGLIKANIPTRIAFSVSSQVDSRTILDASGAEKLLGKGDMLFMENGTGKSIRLQGPFVSDEEIERVTAYAREIAEPNYLFEQEQLLEQLTIEEDEDELLEDAIEFITRQQSASTSMLQRHFKIGYNRAARLIDTMEARGIISGQNGSKPRDVLVTELE